MSLTFSYILTGFSVVNMTVLMTNKTSSIANCILNCFPPVAEMSKSRIQILIYALTKCKSKLHWITQNDKNTLINSIY